MSAKQLWRWQGINNEGEPSEGVLWAETRLSLIQALEQRHITPLRIKRIRVKNSHWSRERNAETIHQLATLLKAGLTLSAALTLLAEQHPSSQWQALLRTLAHDMEQGISLSTSLATWQHVFPPLYQAMIRTGELTGKLDDCCFELARQQKNQQQLADKVKKALRYPIIIITMAVMVVFAMLQFVLPEFAAIYQTFNTPLPALTRGMIAIAHYSSQWGGAGGSIHYALGYDISRDQTETVLAHSESEMVAWAPCYRSNGQRAKTRTDFYRSGVNTKRWHSLFTGS